MSYGNCQQHVGQCSVLRCHSCRITRASRKRLACTAATRALNNNGGGDFEKCTLVGSNEQQCNGCSHEASRLTSELRSNECSHWTACFVEEDIPARYRPCACERSRVRVLNLPNGRGCTPACCLIATADACHCAPSIMPILRPVTHK